MGNFIATNSAAKMKNGILIDDSFPISEAARKKAMFLQRKKLVIPELTWMSILGQREGLQR